VLTSTHTKAFSLSLLLALTACARFTPKTVPLDLHELVAQHELILHPLQNPDLKIETTGRLGPQLGRSSIGQGMGEYDSGFQSALWVCSATGPVAGACLAVMGSLYAVAGAASSLIYHLQSRAMDAAPEAKAALTSGLPPTALSEQIAQRTALLGTAHGFDWKSDSTNFTCANAHARPEKLIVDVDLAEVEVHFEPGYQFNLKVVARFQPMSCNARLELPVRRLAYLGPVLPLSRSPQRAVAALNAEITRAVSALAGYGQDYLLALR
jgi:hypothetical protein